MLLVQLVACAALCGAGETVMLDFTASWCGPCRSMEPVLRRLESEGRSVRKVDIDENRALAQQFGVTGVPCFVMMCEGKEIDRVEGATSYSRLARMFQLAAERTAVPATASQPTARAASQAPMRSAAVEQVAAPTAASAAGSPVEQAYQASVRLKLEDSHGVSYGTGTIIDCNGNEALVLTCGHLFRDSQGQGRLTADLFGGGQQKTVAGRVLRYDLERDLGLVSIQPGVSVTPAPLANSQYQLQRGIQAFSIGCDRGAVPSVQQTQVTNIDRYVGTPNVEAHGAPEVGRSGGGLFDSQGTLIGICNGAQKEDNEGVYASYRAVHEMFEAVGLARLIPRGAPSTALAQASAAMATESRGVNGPVVAESDASEFRSAAQAETSSPRGRPAGFDYTRRRGSGASLAAPTPAVESMQVPAAAAGRLAAMSNAAYTNTTPIAATPAIANVSHVANSPEAEVICIVRSRTNPTAESQVIVLSQPSRQFLDQMSAEAAQSLQPSQPQSLQTARPATYEPIPLRQLDANAAYPAVRAQSPE